LSDRLACKIRGPRLSERIKQLFKGRVVDSGRRKDFQFLINLDLPFVDLEAGLAENLQGHLFGWKSGIKRVTKFPPVLTILLSRFVLPKGPGFMTKNSQRFEFPTRLDLAPHLSDDKKSSVDDETGPGAETKKGEEAKGVAGEGHESFCLHSVLVHRGDTNGGRHYAYIRLPEGGECLKYEDGTVTTVSEAEVLEDSYGPKPPGEGEGEGASTGPSEVAGCAYMLVYIRERDLALVISKLAPDDLSKHLEPSPSQHRKDLTKEPEEQNSSKKPRGR
jgi:hypothetical protein